MGRGTFGILVNDDKAGVKEEDDEDAIADGNVVDDAPDPPTNDAAVVDDNDEVVVVVVKAVVASSAVDNPTLASSSPGILAKRNTRLLHHYRALRTLSQSLFHSSCIQHALIPLTLSTPPTTPKKHTVFSFLFCLYILKST